MEKSQIEAVQVEVESLYRGHYGQMVSSMLYFSSAMDLEAAEDLVQEAFSLALFSWKTKGIPSNPLGWIYTVCKNRAINQAKNQKLILPVYDDLFTGHSDLPGKESSFEDEQLRLLFACAHPHFSPKTQVILTLKYVVNLKIEAIAKVFGMSIDGVDKLLVRVRQKIKDEKILLKEPEPESIKQRINIVHTIIYLIFNEGYKASSGKEILKKELCEEALLLNKSLWESNHGNHDTAALHALMLFNAARFESRFRHDGALLDLEEQDRTLWNRELIGLGCVFLKKAKEGAVSTFHYEASISFLHCTAKSFAQTNWKSISGLYEKILEIYQNPFVELNLAIALYYSGNKEKSKQILTKLQQQPLLNHYYLLNATLGKINLMEGNFKDAKKYLLKTLKQTKFEVEKNYILSLINKIDLLNPGG